MKKRLTKESLARMLNQINVSFLDFYKKAKDVVSLLKMQIYGVFFILSFSCLTRESFYLGVITKFAVQTKNKIKKGKENEKTNWYIYSTFVCSKYINGWV
jgi:hypothetical protein